MCLLCNGWHICSPYTPRTHETPCHAVPKTRSHKQADRQASKQESYQKSAREQTGSRGVSTKKNVRNEKKLTHKYLSSFILLFVCLGEMSMSASMNMHIKHTECGTQFAHTTPIMSRNVFHAFIIVIIPYIM